MELIAEEGEAQARRGAHLNRGGIALKIPSPIEPMSWRKGVRVAGDGLIGEGRLAAGLAGA
jgi:hypothetical protein